MVFARVMGDIPCWLGVLVSHRVVGYTWPPWERGTLVAGMLKLEMRRIYDENVYEKMEMKWNGML